MALQQQIGIKISLDSSSVTSGTQQAARALTQLGTAAKGAGEVSTKAMGNLSVGLNDVARRVEILAALTATVHGLGAAIVALPRNAFDYSKNLETTQVGMAGILGSMTSINGQQVQYNAALAISRDMIRKLNDDALRTAASSQELTSTFQALLAPGLSARMTLEQIRELTVVGTNAVKSMGIAGNQVVQELRDLVSGGITASGSQLASALGLKDEDIAQARASSEGLFAFLMERLKGFAASADDFGNTLQGRLDTLQEAAVRVAAAGMQPLTEAVKVAAKETAGLFGVFEAGKDAQLNPLLVESVTQYAEAAVKVIDLGKHLTEVVWENREALLLLWSVYKVYSFSQAATEIVTLTQAKMAAGQASRLAAMEAAVEAAANNTVSVSARDKAAAYLAELQAKATNTQATAAATEAELLSLNAERNAIAIKQASATAAFEQARASMVASEAHLVAARSAGALSFALAATREASDALNAAQARRAAVGAELAALTARQAQVEAALTAATAAHTAASNAAAVASSGLAAATGAASIAGRAFSTVVGALGGPVGIAILAVSSLAMWLWQTKSAANEAEKALFHLNRAKADAAAGKPVQERDLVSVRAGLQQAQEELDALEQRAKNIAPNKAAQERFQENLDKAKAKAKAKVAEYEALLQRSQEASARTAQGTAVREVGAHNLSAVDVLVGGFPCQDVSSMGARAGLAGQRTGLFWEVCRIVQEIRPQWVVLENVVGLLTSQGGRDFGVVLGALAERGYVGLWRVLDAQYFGVAQRRRRVFLVAGLGRQPPAGLLSDASPVDALPGTISPQQESRFADEWPANCLLAKNSAGLIAIGCENLVCHRGGRSAMVERARVSEAAGIPRGLDATDHTEVRAAGNAVCVPVARWIADHLRAAI